MRSRVRKPNRRTRAFSGKRRRKHGSYWTKHRRHPLCLGYFYAKRREKRRAQPEMYDSIAEVFGR